MIAADVVAEKNADGGSSGKTRTAAVKIAADVVVMVTADVTTTADAIAAINLQIKN